MFCRNNPTGSSGAESGWIGIDGHTQSKTETISLQVNCHGSEENITNNDFLVGKWLSDLHIHAAQLLIKKVSELQNPILGQNLTFKAAEGDMVQVLRSGGDHWLTVSTAKAINVVREYDSLGTSLPSQTKKQIASLMKTKDNSITIEYASVQVRNCFNGFIIYYS